MTLEAAPYFSDVAEGPGTGAAWWVRAEDGVRIRVAAWPLEGAKGTLLLMPGRTEYVEKYAKFAGELAEHGYAMMAVDWRGQGLADRLLPDPMIGHVETFTDYQRDVTAMLRVADTLDLPKPWHVLGHSMGGAIALRAVLDGADVASAAFTGPMWGILFAPVMRQLAWGLYYASGWAGQGHRMPPTTTKDSYVAVSPFADNVLTNDEPMWDYMKRQVKAHPELSLGGPSLRWLGEAMRECNALMAAPAPGVPAICFVGEQESIVDRTKMKERMDRWPGGQFEVVAQSQHEVLMEGPAVRAQVLDKVVDLFARGAEQADMARAG